MNAIKVMNNNKSERRKVLHLGVGNIRWRGSRQEPRHPRSSLTPLRVSVFPRGCSTTVLVSLYVDEVVAAAATANIKYKNSGGGSGCVWVAEYNFVLRLACRCLALMDVRYCGSGESTRRYMKYCCIMFYTRPSTICQ